MAAIVRNTILLLPFLLWPLPTLAFDSQCVSSFKSNPKRFDVCLTEPCFMFREEEPYIFLNNSMDEKPFRCVDYKSKSSKLDGAFFATVSNISTLQNAYCLYAGPNCTFNGMVSFINSSAARSDHQWIAGGILFVLQRRILPGVVPSTSILEDALHVVGPPSTNKEPLKAAWDLVLKPFSVKAWVTLLGVVGLFVIVRVFMIYLFGSPSGPGAFFRSLVLCTFQDDKEKRNNSRSVTKSDWFRILNRHWKLAFFFFGAVLLLLYEVALAVIAFESIGIKPLLDPQPEKFALIRNTTQEYFFLKMVGRNGKHSTFNTESQVYDALRDPTSDLEYTVSYGIDNRYQFARKPRLCDDLRLYDTVPSALVKGRQPPPISGVWFYSAKIPDQRRMSIDKEILKLKEKGRVMEFVDLAIGSEKLGDHCKPRRTRISGYILFLLVLFPLCYLVGICVTMAVAEIRERLKPTALAYSDSGSSTVASEPAGCSHSESVSGRSEAASSFASLGSDETAAVGRATIKNGGLSETRRRSTP